MTSDKKLFAYLSFLLFISGLFAQWTILNKMEYVFLGLTIFVAIIHILKNRLYTPSGYIIWVAFYVFISIIASVLSVYCTNIMQFSIGIGTALIPFIYFIASYNYYFSNKEIVKYIDILITIGEYSKNIAKKATELGMENIFEFENIEIYSPFHKKIVYRGYYDFPYIYLTLCSKWMYYEPSINLILNLESKEIITIPEEYMLIGIF